MEGTAQVLEAKVQPRGPTKHVVRLHLRCSNGDEARAAALSLTEFHRAPAF